jgi:hypothetical protein
MICNFPEGAEAFGVAKVGYLSRTVTSQQEIFWVDVAVGDTSSMDIFDSAHQLKKVAVPNCTKPKFERL